jgi:hypothetical protein
VVDAVLLSFRRALSEVLAALKPDVAMPFSMTSFEVSLPTVKVSLLFSYQLDSHDLAALKHMMGPSNWE